MLAFPLWASNRLGPRLGPPSTQAGATWENSPIND